MHIQASFSPTLTHIYNIHIHKHTHKDRLSCWCWAIWCSVANSVLHMMVSFLCTVQRIYPVFGCILSENSNPSWRFYTLKARLFFFSWNIHLETKFHRIPNVDADRNLNRLYWRTRDSPTWGQTNTWILVAVERTGRWSTERYRDMLSVLLIMITFHPGLIYLSYL